MAHGIAAIGLETEAFCDLSRQQVASHVFAACRDNDIACLEWRQPIRIDVRENAGGGSKLQKSDVFALGNCTGKLRLHLDDVRVGEPADQVYIVNGEIDYDADIRHARWERPDTSDSNRENIFTADRLLDRLDSGIEALDVADHQGYTSPACSTDNFASFFNRRGNRLFD